MFISDHIQLKKHLQKGVGLLEVLVAVLVLAIGIMALARFQGGLTRSGSDAKARTVATNLAQEQMERLRTFNTNAEFLAIDDGTKDPPDVLSGTEFKTTWTVTDYIFPGTGAALTTTLNGANPKIKQVQVNVTWTDPSGSTETVLLDSFISLSLPTESGQTLTPPAGSRRDPKVGYKPGDPPEIVAIPVTNNETVESTMPVPQITKASSTNVVDFDKVAYDSSSKEAQKREAFRMITCVCQLQKSPDKALTPAYFDIDFQEPLESFWKEGDQVSKTVGISADKKQPQLCDICCRDHHDPGTASTDIYKYYDPVRNYNAAEDHKHYSFSGSFSEVSGTAEYLESCRFVRIDGIWRVAQDWRQESLQIIPAEFLKLNNNDGIDVVVDYLDAFIREYITAISTGTYPDPTLSIDPSNDKSSVFADWKKLPNEEAQDEDETLMSDDQSLPEPPTATTSELTSRAIYIEYMDSALITELKNSIAANSFDLSKVPFSEVNTTLLANWQPQNDTGEVEVTNEPTDNSGYSRGEVTPVSIGEASVKATIKRSTTGLAGSIAIDPDDAELADDSLRFVVGSSGGGSEPVAITVSGKLDLKALDTKILKAQDIKITSSTEGVSCTYDSDTLFYSCGLKSGVTSFEIKVTGYNYMVTIDCPEGAKKKDQYPVDVVQDNSVQASGSPEWVPSTSIDDNGKLADRTTFTFSNAPTGVTAFTMDLTFDEGITGSCP